MGPHELLERLVRGQLANVRFADARRLVEALGFRLDRVRGSHHIYRHPVIRQRINLQPRVSARTQRSHTRASLPASHLLGPLTPAPAPEPAEPGHPSAPPCELRLQVCVDRQPCPTFAPPLAAHVCAPLSLAPGELDPEDRHGSSELGDLSEATKGAVEDVMDALGPLSRELGLAAGMENPAVPMAVALELLPQICALPVLGCDATTGWPRRSRWRCRHRCWPG